MLSEIPASKSFIDRFISSHVTGQGLDRRTEKAYRLDLEHFYAWAERKQEEASGGRKESAIEAIQKDKPGTKQESGSQAPPQTWEEWMEAYLDYLDQEKKLSLSTRCRKNRVFGYYLSYLAEQGVISGCRSLKPVKSWGQKEKTASFSQNFLSRKEADAFFAAMDKEYRGLNSEFRRRICLRDMVMMELLFYHKIEISELLRIEVPDYDREKGQLTVRRKKGSDYQLQLFSQGLQQRMEQWLEERSYFRREGEFKERMFLSKLGKPLSMEMLIQIFNKYRKLAGIEKEFTPRNLKESSMKQCVRELMMERCG